MTNMASTLLENPQLDKIMHFAGILADPIIRSTMVYLMTHGTISNNHAQLSITCHEVIKNLERDENGDLTSKKIKEYSLSRREISPSLVRLEKEGLATSKKIKER